MTNIDKYSVATNVREYHIIIVSKSIFLKIIISKFMMIIQLFQVNNGCKMLKINMFKMEVGTFGQNFKVAFYIIPNCIKNH